MMEPMETCVVPPGFRFHPTDEELVGYYLRKKIASQKIDLDVIRDIDLYRIEPWDLQEKCRIGYEEQKEWYFFSHKDKKYPTGTKTNRATMAGFWKATGRDKAIYDKGKLIGMRKTLVFYKGRAPNGQKTDWIMHEYRLESHENGPPQEEGWVVCRAFKKRATSQTKCLEAWHTSYFYDNEPSSGMSSIVDEYITRAPNSVPPITNSQVSRVLCKKETQGDNLNFLNNNSHDQLIFSQLPQLESPSVQLMIKRPLPMPSSSLLIDQTTNKLLLEEDEEAIYGNNKKKKKKKLVTDWRALDKFVASQLSHEERYMINDESLLVFQQDEIDSSTASNNVQMGGYSIGADQCDNNNVGICIFDK